MARGVPLDVALGMLHHLLLQFKEVPHFIAGCRLLGALPTLFWGLARGPAGFLPPTLGPDSRFLHLVPAAHLGLITPMALGPFPALSPPMTLAVLPTLTVLLALNACPNPVKFRLPIFAPDS